MPTYDYRCEANQEIFEVKHSMSIVLKSWGELCQFLGIDIGKIAPDTKVTRLISGGAVVNSGNLKNSPVPSCMSGGKCSGGGGI